MRGATWVWLGVAACGGAAAPATTASPAAATRGANYEVVLSADGGELAVEATLARGLGPELVVEDDAAPFIDRVEVAGAAGAFRSVARTGETWRAPECAAHGCRLRYRVRLAEAARAIDEVGTAAVYDGAFLAPPSTFLLRPTTPEAGLPFRFHVTAPAPLSFEAGTTAVRGAPHTYESDLSDLPEAPYAAFGRLRARDVSVAGAAAPPIRLTIVPGVLEAVNEEEIIRWIGNSARAVAGYYGRYPVERVLVIVIPSRGHGVGYATTLGNGGASIVARIGRRTQPDELTRDWAMTHEMVHLALPNLAREHAWLEEGLATYVEPLARARIGTLAVDEVWTGLARGLPLGQPAAGDRGLDRTPTWGRTYWGGALFCLLADVAIRERTGNRRSLDDALRGILAAGGNVAVRWEIERVLDEGDRATGVPVLRELHERLGARPETIDIEGLFRRLGVRAERDAVRYDDGAPLAGIRRAMTSPQPIAAASSTTTTPRAPSAAGASAP